jgi:hypothetical protein
LLGLIGEAGDLLGAPDLLLGNAEVSRRSIRTTLVPMAPAILEFGSFISAKLSEMIFTVLLSHRRVFGDLLRPLRRGQFGAVKVFGDRPHARRRLVPLLHEAIDVGMAKAPARLKPMSASDKIKPGPACARVSIGIQQICTSDGLIPDGDVSAWST